jgi:hypothetical protein
VECFGEGLRRGERARQSERDFVPKKAIERKPTRAKETDFNAAVEKRSSNARVRGWWAIRVVEGIGGG